MMMQYWQIIGHVGITIVAVVGLAFRIEHRLTKIETDVSWLKKSWITKAKGECENGEHCEVD